ncbi:MAG: hypothetical protein AAGC47_13300 [Bacteroidota bacterium]
MSLSNLAFKNACIFVFIVSFGCNSVDEVEMDTAEFLECEEGFCGANCDQIAPAPCVNGAYNSTSCFCICESGWAGALCDVPLNQPNTLRADIVYDNGDTVTFETTSIDATFESNSIRFDGSLSDEEWIVLELEDPQNPIFDTEYLIDLGSFAAISQPETDFTNWPIDYFNPSAPARVRILAINQSAETIDLIFQFPVISPNQQNTAQVINGRIVIR